MGSSLGYDKEAIILYNVTEAIRFKQYLEVKRLAFYKHWCLKFIFLLTDFRYLLSLFLFVCYLFRPGQHG